MSSDLSPQNERFIHQVLADGVFSSRESLLNCAVDSLRVAAAESPTAARLAEELRLVDEAIDDVESRGSVAWDSAVVTRRILERLAETGAPAND